MLNVLIVDDEPKWRALISGELEDQGHHVMTAGSGEEALERLSAGDGGCDLILTDLRMEPMNGLALMREVRAKNSDSDIVMITAFADTQTAVDAMKLGAYDFLQKPFELDELHHLVRRVEEKRGLKAENRALKAMIEGGPAGDMVGESAVMKQVFELISKVAASEATVLIRGESGTGKELVARMVHERSPRVAGPFKAVNCAALPESLLESELFGHERGAFTGADKRRIGLFEATSSGTLFLDEIGEVPPSVQSKLLRALEEREITRLGSTETISVDTRVVAATNVDLEGAIEDGVFRQDLYYRLNVFPIQLPALRQRTEDVGLLARRFLAELFPGEGVELDPTLVELLEGYDWPGNVRELRNVVERATILAGGPAIGAEHMVLPAAPAGAATPGAATAGAVAAGAAAAGAAAGEPSNPGGAPRPGEGEELHLPADGVNLEHLEARFIREALTRARGNKSQAARLLGITRRALYCRMEKYRIDQEESGQQSGEAPDAPRGSR